jgi:hypothetical protein
MKNLHILLLTFVMSVFMSSCSTSDDNDTNNNEPLVGNYFPSANTNIWTYDVDNTSTTNPDLNFTDAPDFVTIETSSGNTFTLEINNGGISNGIMNGFLGNGNLTRGDSTLSYTGNIELPGEFQNFTSETIMLQNFELYNLNAANNAVFGELGGVIVEDLDLNGTIVPLTVEYLITSQKISQMNSMSVNGQSYSNVTRSRLTLNMNIFASIDLLGGSNPADYSIISDQDVLVIDNYFAENFGLIKSEAVYSYELEQQFIDLLELIPNTVDVPESMNVVNIQDLDDAQIN